MNECNKILGEVFEKTDSEIENRQEIVPVEIGSDNSEDQNDSLLQKIIFPVISIERDFRCVNQKSQFFENITK